MVHIPCNRADFENSEKVEDLIAAIEYIDNHPPRVQNIVHGQLGWQDRNLGENTPLINRLGLSIRGIRNNLFHGGKFNGN